MARIIWKSMEYILVVYSMWSMCGRMTDAMNCMQCTSLDNNGSTYGGSLHLLHKDACLLGKVQPTPCTNPNHTYCTTYHVRTPVLDNLIFVWRKCGIYNDTLHPCRSHTLDEDGNLGGVVDDDTEYYSPDNIRMETKGHAKANIRICVYGCPNDGCVASQAVRNHLSVMLIVAVITGLIV